MKNVLASTGEGQVILDSFCGSRTTGVEAVRFGCKFIGIDISEEYLEISKKRLEKVSKWQIEILMKGWAIQTEYIKLWLLYRL